MPAHVEVPAQGGLGLAFCVDFFVVFLVVCCRVFAEILKFVFPHSLPKPFPNFPISPSPSNPSRWRSLSDFSSTSLSVPHLLITILTRQSPKPFVKGLKKPSAGQYPRAHTSPVITPQSLAQTLCAWSWYNHIQPLPTVFHDRSKKKPKQTAATA